ncbi:glucose PTS transporter subunit IIA [Nakamurella deserti]|uniref:glucose PTS transporter subunit IIA n=1 Tax=Nakamurella deserti TaxID=2164074 RepID=UPI000DBE6327|nr:glucose PTS transporter subunit IIA [Nakamurella deserti]
MSTATTSAAAAPPRKRSGLRIPGFAQLQRLGKSLMLPIALLPAAGILLRLGQPDLLGGMSTPVIGPFFDAMSAAGGAIFSHLPLLFAVGVAIGFAKKADGSTALAAVAGYLVIEAVFTTMSPVVLDGDEVINFSVFAGILVGLITAVLFDRFHNIQLPSYLGFFGGRRFVPIVVSVSTLLLGFALSYLYPLFDAGLTSVGQFIGGSGAFGAFAYGFANRMLIPLGLHHILNTYVWFLYGDYTPPGGGAAVTGELTRFAAGDVTAGLLTSGFYPILMFGLPAAALAMIHVAHKKQRKVALGILSAAGLTAFLTGVTEPLEFSFMFVAFPLYVVHAVLTGLSLAIAYLLDIHLGFSFSAGLIDLLLYGTAPAAKNIPLLIGMGVVFFAVYYLLFRFAITRWNMRTPGRQPEAEFEAEQAANLTDATASEGGAAGGTAVDSQAERLIAAFGGRENLVNVDACMTRLRMEVADPAKVDRSRLKALGAAGVIDVGSNVQAVFGTQADTLKNQIKDALAATPVLVGAGTTGAASVPAVPTTASTHTASTDTASTDTASTGSASTGSAGSPAGTGTTVVRSPLPGRTVALTDVPDQVFAQGLVGFGMAVQPPMEVVEAVAPVSGRIHTLLPHAYVVMTDDNVGVLVHLGLNTVQLQGEGFTAHVAAGDRVEVGQPVMRYDVPAVAATGRPTVVPVVVMEKPVTAVAVEAAVAATAATGDRLFTVTH